MGGSTTTRHRAPGVRTVAPLGALAPLSTLALLGTLAGCAAAAEAPQDAGAVDARYRDGSYRADGAYQSPAGGESIIVVLRLENDIVTDVEIGLYPTSATSSTYQSMFASGIADLVVGRDIDSLEVAVVAGSSLTSAGFRAALASITAEALDD